MDKDSEIHLIVLDPYHSEHKISKNRRTIRQHPGRQLLLFVIDPPSKLGVCENNQFVRQ